MSFPGPPPPPPPSLGVVFDAKLLDLARDGVAPHAEQVGGIDPPSAGARQRLADQRALELTPERIQNSGIAARQAALRLLLQRGQPVRRGAAAWSEIPAAGPDVDHLRRRHHGHPMANVLELANIAGKLKATTRFSALHRSCAWARRPVACTRGEEMPREHRNVLGALAQRGSRSGSR